MPRLIVSLSLLFFIAIISIGGCGGGGMDDGAEPTLPPTIPPTSPPGSQGCLDCPCDIFGIPMTSECWKSPEFSILVFGIDKFCFLSNPGTNIQVFSDSSSGSKVCLIRFSEAHESCGSDFHQGGLSNEELEACMDCLEDYATDLNDSGISVDGGPPYNCPD